MKIEKLVIYGFGKHEDVTIQLGSSINLLYGHNEAGKTTIQQFILHVLFGFPLRNSQTLRYEPRSSSKYGGQVHLVDDVYGHCVVERVGGKSAGDVKVFFGNGEQGEEEALQKVLRQYDRAAFESIFSFSLLQLQGFEKMDEQELSRTLLASGTTGVDYLLQIEEKMEKEMDALFKRKGRRPVLNEKMGELRQLEGQLQDEQKKMAHYAPAIKRLKEIAESLEQLREQQKQLDNQISELTLKRQLLPVSMKKHDLTARFNAIAAQQFPTDGMSRYESNKNKLAEVEAAAFSIQQELNRLTSLLDMKSEEEKLLTLEQIIAQESEWHRMHSSIATVRTQSQQLAEERVRLSTRLGLQTEQDMVDLLQADASIRKEEEMYALLAELDANQRELEMIDREWKKTAEKLGRMQEKDYLFTPPTEDERQQTKNWPKIREQIAEAKAYLSFHQHQQYQSKMIGIILLVLILFLVGYSLISKQYGLLLVASVISVIPLFFMKRRTNDAKAAKMEALLATYEGQEQEMSDGFLNIERYEREKELHEEAKINYEMDMRHLKATYDERNERIAQNEVQLSSFLASYGIEGLPSKNMIPELFRLIREIQEVTGKIIHKDREEGQLALNIQNRLQESEALLQRTIPKEGLYEWVRKEHQLLHQALERHKTEALRRSELQSALEEKNALIRLLKQQQQSLFEEAQVHHESAYYEAAKTQREKVSLEEQIRNLRMQLVVHGEIEIDKSLTDVTLENRLVDMQEAIVKSNQQQVILVEEQARLENETNALLSDETYSKLQQQFEVERAQFTELAKEWAAKRALASAIQQMMNDLREKKLPKVLTKASELFSELTGGRYQSMRMNTQGYFDVVSQAGIHHPIVELSQATKEQAYISLRLALAISIRETAPFPIIMDDPFVHFDESRLSHIIEVLERLTEHQFIYFTCHEKMQHRIKQATTINVSKIGKKREANE